MKYLIILSSAIAVVLFIYFAVTVGNFVYQFLGSNEIVKVPFTRCVYIAKVKGAEWKGTKSVNIEYYFEKYIELMNKKGWTYNSEKRQGGLLFFEKENVTRVKLFPKFIGIKY